MTFYIYIFIFIIGLIFGSFAGLIIHRLRTKQKGIWFGRSKCPKCKHELGIADLIPLVGYLINGRKCRYCKKKISAFYPFIELVMGCMFVLTALLVGIHTIDLLAFYLLITFVFVVLTIYDFLYKEIPDEVVLPAFFVSFLFLGINGVHSFASLAIGVGIPVAFFSILFFGSRGKWLGGGDIRIGALMGALLGWPNILIGLFLGYLLGAVFSLTGLVTKQLTRKSQIPFAPFLLIGAYIAMFWGKEIVSWYLNVL